MKAEQSNLYQQKTERVNKLIEERKLGSLMNNTKWKKVSGMLETQFETVYINFKLVYNEDIKNVVFSLVDCQSYFIEPILYKEVEWIEFPKTYTYWINENNKKAGKKEFTQDIQTIQLQIEKMGQFCLESYTDKIRLYAYL